MARTDPKDVARVESKTVIISENRNDTLTTPKEGVKGQLGYWMAKSDLDEAIKERFPGCMKGKKKSFNSTDDVIYTTGYL